MWINSFVGRQMFTGLPPCVPLRPRCEATNAKAPKGASVEAGSLCSSVRGPCRGSSWPVGGRGWGRPPEGLRGAGPPGPARVLPAATEGNRACDMQGLLLGEGRWNEPTACGWMAGWMAILIPASGIWKSEVKGQASQGCTSAGGRLLLPPPLPPPPRRVRSGPPGGNEPLAPSPSVPPGQEPETPASCGAGKRWATPGFPSAFREHVTARRKPRRAGEGRGEGQLPRSLTLGSVRAFAGGPGERAGPHGRPRGARGACQPPAVPPPACSILVSSASASLPPLSSANWSSLSFLLPLLWPPSVPRPHPLPPSVSPDGPPARLLRACLSIFLFLASPAGLQATPWVLSL